MLDGPLPKAVVFDFDGVLADSVDVKTEAFAALYADDGPEIVSQVVAHHLRYGGVSRYEKLRHYQQNLVQRCCADATINSLADRFAAEVKHRVIASPEIPGAGDVLATLHGHTRMFVASGTPEEELLDIVAQRQLGHFFDRVRGAPDKKPKILREAMALTGAGPAQTVMVGDALTDYEAAVEIGCPFIGVMDKTGAHPFPSGALVIPDMRRFLEVLATLQPAYSGLVGSV